MEIGKWIDHEYGSGADIDFANGIGITVIYDACRSKESDIKPFVVNVLGERLIKRFDDFEEAKKYAVQMLKEQLEFALGFVNVYLNKK